MGYDGKEFRRRDPNPVAAGLVVVALIVGTIAGAGLWQWFAAGVQVEVYRRQGVQMTRFEVFMGAKPVERSFRVAPEQN